MSEFIVVITFTDLDNVVGHKISYSKQFEDQLRENAERHKKNLEKESKYTTAVRYYKVINGIQGALYCKKIFRNSIYYGSLETIEVSILDYKNSEKAGFRRVGRITCIDCHKSFVPETEHTAGFNRCLRCFQKYEQCNKNAYSGTADQIGSNRPFYVRKSDHLSYKGGKFVHPHREVQGDTTISADFEITFDVDQNREERDEEEDEDVDEDVDEDEDEDEDLDESIEQISEESEYESENVDDSEDGSSYCPSEEESDNIEISNDELDNKEDELDNIEISDDELDNIEISDDELDIIEISDDEVIYNFDNKEDDDFKHIINSSKKRKRVVIEDSDTESQESNSKNICNRIYNNVINLIN
jgi:hypothetical protein